jgi:hypothetical protein
MLLSSNSKPGLCVSLGASKQFTRTNQKTQNKLILVVYHIEKNKIVASVGPIGLLYLVVNMRLIFYLRVCRRVQF